MQRSSSRQKLTVLLVADPVVLGDQAVLEAQAALEAADPVVQEAQEVPEDLVVADQVAPGAQGVLAAQEDLVAVDPADLEVPVAQEALADQVALEVQAVMVVVPLVEEVAANVPVLLKY